MKKRLLVLLTAYFLTNFGLQAAGFHADSQAANTAPKAPDDNDTTLSEPKFHTTFDVHERISGFVPDSSNTMNSSKTMRMAALSKAAMEYAKALRMGEHVPDEAMKVMRTARNDMRFDSTGIDKEKERKRVTQLIMDELRDAERGNIIHLPNRIPPFLAGHVADKKAERIDAMPLNPHIAEHMKHSGYYYEDKDNKWSEQTAAALQRTLEAMAKEYRLLDDAVKEGADLTGVKYIVIPEVGATNTAITSRTVQLDKLFKANPNLTLVVAFADDVTDVDDNFCYNSPTGGPTLSPHVKKISFTGKNIKTVGENFFSNTKALTSVDFRGLSSLQTVGNYFFSNTKTLTSVDFRSLSSLQTVGNSFFSWSEKLTSVDFGGLSALQTVGDYFFSRAQALTSVDFGGLSALQTVGDYFFYDARSLTSVDFSALSALQTVGDYFFSRAQALTSVDFRGLSALQTVGNYFFLDAKALTSVDFRGLSALQTVGDRFFYGSQALTSVNFSGLSALRTVGNYFFSNTKALTSVDFSGLSALQTVGDFFFSDAKALTSVDFSGLSALQTVGNQVFAYAWALTSVNFKGLSALQTVGNQVFAYADKLQTIACTAAIEPLLKGKYKGKAKFIVAPRSAVAAG